MELLEKIKQDIKDIEEIDELLNTLKTSSLEPHEEYTMEFSNREQKLLFDYITNLQEENKELKKYQEGYRKEIDYWRIQFSNNKDIIDKAIEYIKQFEDIKAYYSWVEDGYEEYNYDEDFKKDILSILEKGE